MKALRSFLALLALSLWQFAWAVDVAPGQGVTFVQVGYADDPTSTYTPIGVIQVDLNRLRNVTGIATGYLNLATSKGWVVRNLPVFPESSYPYSAINSEFDLGVQLGTAVTQLPVALQYTESSVTAFGATPAATYPVAPLSLTIGGAGTSGGGPVTPPTFSDILFANPSDTDSIIQYDHPDIETAQNQCLPMSIANSLQYLKDTQGLQVPHEHKPGQNGDDSLVGQLDVAGARPVVDRQHGSGTPSMLTTKLTYLAKNNMAGSISTTHWGGYYADSATNTSVTVNGVTASSTAQGSTINMDGVIQALKEGQDCEMIYSWATGAHAVDIVGAGKYKGQPWILHASDQVQANAANPNADSQGAGPAGLRFEYLGPPDAHSQYSFRNRTMQEVVCEKYVPPPVTETVTHTTDPAGHSCCVQPPPGSVSIAVYGNSMTMSGTAAWLPLKGTISANGSFSLASTATVAGFSNVTSSFVGTLQGGGYNGTITVGTGGQLPTGQSIAWDVATSPTTFASMPAIRVNGFRHSYAAAEQAQLLRPAISMKAGSKAGQSADWWLLAAAGSAFYHFDLGAMSWKPGLAPTFSGPLADVPFFALPYLQLPSGTYDMYFGFDTTPDGAFTPQTAVYDSVRVTVP